MKIAHAVFAVFGVVAIAYVGPQVVAHRDPMLVYLRDSTRWHKADLIPAIFPANTPRSVVYNLLNERGFTGPFKLMRKPNGDLYADEGYRLENLFWSYSILLIYDGDGKLIKGWGAAVPLGKE